jgi:hypothetical protein
MGLMKVEQYDGGGKNPIHRKVPTALSPAGLAKQYAEVLWLREQVRIYERRQNPRRTQPSNLRNEAKSDRSVGATEIQWLERCRSRRKT